MTFQNIKHILCFLLRHLLCMHLESSSGIDFCEECKIQSYFYSKVQKLFTKVHSLLTEFKMF